ncbi:hypothetical protein DSO57_1013730 [Entomophthora muscae]|uniref:Uncharacterized protein n=1 Tax=Entomophthora muscae TaxID=34485 RepID=A0ACC2USP2_9FUNG|nr:hypothetical protein DSO57_1013730 [Entomophthora muscae]
MKIILYIFFVQLGLALSTADKLSVNNLDIKGAIFGRSANNEGSNTTKLPSNSTDEHDAELITKVIREIGGKTPDDDSPSKYSPKRDQPEYVASHPSSEAEAYRVMSFASLAYCTVPSVEKMTCQACQHVQGAEVSQIFSDRDTTGRAVLLLDKKRDEIILTFRGSHTLDNWISNLVFFLTPALYAKDTQVHYGFKQACDALMFNIFDPLKKILNEHPNYKLIITGHSLGAAVATLAASDLLHRKMITPKRLHLFTYGEPRTGNLAFVRWLNSQPAHITRVVNENEIVPHVPPASFGSAHHSTEMYIHNNKSRICSTKEIEDPTCSLSRFPNLSILNHLRYWDVYMTCND